MLKVYIIFGVKFFNSSFLNKAAYSLTSRSCWFYWLYKARH
ncbi:hypothetical protein PHAMO_250005 [Magnetospirillum molischianum DSM 120]|uniref:Uncharacterized protein n=1 Tax=Magnetospirillum molischianum DSM 120 TaxID=1150626 RepID=H8FRY7_MAGML|nr:hypothetical protein PHAMO_250005 [Magnetospirillum molischianum DSM 120]